MKHGSIPMAAIQRILQTLLLTAIVLLAGGAIADQQSQLVLVNRDCAIADDNTWLGSTEQLLRNVGSLVEHLCAGAIGNGGFLNGSYGDPPDQVFGHVMCYVNYNWTMCESCLAAAQSLPNEQCPYAWDAGVIYDACALRYSNNSSFSVPGASIRCWYIDGSDWYVHDIVAMNETRRRLMSRLVPEASGSSARFANGGLPYTDSLGTSLEIYGLMQCSRDLAPDECADCLQSGLTNLASANSTTGHVRSYSCYVTYSMEPIEIRSPSPPEPVEIPSPSPAGTISHSHICMRRKTDIASEFSQSVSLYSGVVPASSSKLGKKKLIIAVSVVVGFILSI